MFIQKLNTKITFKINNQIDLGSTDVHTKMSVTPIWIEYRILKAESLSRLYIDWLYLQQEYLANAHFRQCT